MDSIELENLYEDFLNKIGNIDKSFLQMSDLPSEIFHYTNLGSLKAIVEKPYSLWATNYKFLNDKKEVTHLEPNLKRVLNKLYNNQKEFSDWLLNNYSKVRRIMSDYIFVISFSNKKDSLTLWSNYTNNDGYCIVFDKELFLEKDFKIKEQKITKQVIGRNVIYDDDLKDKILIKLIEVIFEYYTNRSIINTYFSELMKFAMIYLFSFALTSKDKKYEDEHEFRLIFPLPDHNLEDIEFRVSHDIIIPYIKVCFDFKYVTEIMIGPKRRMDITKASLDYFLCAKGHQDIHITKSKIPLRY